MKLQYHDLKHQYWLDGTRAKSISKVADICADKFTVEQWSKRMVAIGMTLDPTLIEKVAVDLDNRDTIQEVCEDATRTAKASARAERGTQRHRVLELMLLGREDEFITDQQRADAVVLARTLDAYGLEPIPEFVEQFVAYPDHCVVGRFDALLQHEGRPVLTDLKGGPNAVKYPHSTLTQTALYRFAPHVSAKIERDGDKSVVTEWTTWPDGTDEDVAYVIYCDDDHDVGELWRLDLQHGWAGADLALCLVDWRKANNYGRKAVKQIAATADSAAEAVGQPAPDGSPLPSGATTLEAAKRRMALDAERRPSSSPPDDEGGPADEGDINTAKGRWELGMDAEQKAWTGAVVKDAIAAGHDFRTSVKPTQRRADLYCAITKLVYSDYWGKGFDDVVRALLYAVVGDDQVLGAGKIGPFVGQLDTGQASLFRANADSLVDGHTVLVADAAGKLAVQAAA